MTHELKKTTVIVSICTLEPLQGDVYICVFYIYTRPRGRAAQSPASRRDRSGPSWVIVIAASRSAMTANFHTSTATLSVTPFRAIGSEWGPFSFTSVGASLFRRLASNPFSPPPHHLAPPPHPLLLHPHRPPRWTRLPVASPNPTRPTHWTLHLSGLIL